MVHIKIPRGWELPESAVTPEAVYLNRRRFLKALGLGGLSLGATLAGCRTDEANTPDKEPQVPTGDTNGALKPAAGPRDFQEAHAELYGGVKRNEAYKVEERGITEEKLATTYNNFYEFSTDKEEVHELTGRFVTNPWTIQVSGLVEKPGMLDLDKLMRRMPLEERVYRFRCVEAWSMTVPWSGFPLAALLKEVQPLAKAKYVRLVTALRREEMPGVPAAPYYPWPYFEGLRLDEAMNELTMLVTGAYGHALPDQNGAPIRLITPWKYGYKSIKSIVSIELVEAQPKTFWNTLVPDEYDFWSNVNPNVPHPRWSQATERLLDTGDRIPTQMYNGYADFVASMYPG